MSGATGENNTRKPDEQDNQCSLKQRRTMWFYCGLLSGSLLVVGGVTGSRFFKESRSFGWSLLRFTTSSTGMYLTFSSIQRLCNSSRDSISEEANTPLKDTQAPEKFDKSGEKESLHRTKCTDAKDNIIENINNVTVQEETEAVINADTDIDMNCEDNNVLENPEVSMALRGTDCTESITVEDNIVENAIDDTAEETTEAVFNATTEIDINCEENNVIENPEVLMALHVTECTESITVENTIDDTVEGKMEAISNVTTYIDKNSEENNVIENPEVSMALQCTDCTETTTVENTIDDTVEGKMKAIRNVATYIDKNSEENNVIENSAEQLGSNGSIVLKGEGKENIVFGEVECTITQNIVPGDINDEEVVVNEAFDDSNEDTTVQSNPIQSNTTVQNDPVLETDVHTDVKGCKTEVMEANYITFETTVATQILVQEDIKDEEVMVKALDGSSTEGITQGISTNNSIKETGVHVDVKGCETDVMEAENVDFEIKTTMPDINATVIFKQLDYIELSEKDIKLSEILDNSSNENNINLPVSVDNLFGSYYNEPVSSLKEYSMQEPNIENIISKEIVPDQVAAEDLLTSKLDEQITTKDIIEEGIFTQETEIHKFAIHKNPQEEKDSPYLLVEKTTQIKESEIRNVRTVGEITVDQNVNEALRTEYSTTMPIIERFPKVAESPTVQRINQLLSNSTDELRFISPNTASDIGVFFRKANKTRLAAQFTNTSKVPVNYFKESEPSLSQQTTNLVRNELPSPTNTDSTTTNKQTSEFLINFKETIAWKPFSNASPEKAQNFSDSHTIFPTSESLNVLNSNKDQSTGTLSSSVAFHEDKTCESDLITGHSLSNSESAVHSIFELLKCDTDVLVLSSFPNEVQQNINQSPMLMDIAGISPSDRLLRFTDTTITSAKDSSPVISDLTVSNPIQSSKLLKTSRGSPVRYSPKPIGSSDKHSRQSPKTSEIRLPSFAGHSPRSQTDDVFLHDKHSPRSSDVDNSFRQTLRSPVGGVGHIRRASWNSAASPTRRSFGRGTSPCSEHPARVSEGDVFSQAADSPWTSYEDISQAGHPSKLRGRDIFSLARSSFWSSCGDVSSRARHSKRTSDGDVFSHAHHSPWVSGSGTVFHAGHSRKPRSSSNPRHSRVVSGGSGVPRVRHSQSPTAFSTTKSQTRNFTSPSGQHSSSSIHDASHTGQSSVSAASLTVQSNDASVDNV